MLRIPPIDARGASRILVSLDVLNPAEENADGGRLNSLLFKGFKADTTAHTLGAIKVSHDGGADDQKGKIDVYLNDGDDSDTPTKVLGITSAGILNIPGLTASYIVETDANKNLVSVAKGTAYNKAFGTGAGDVCQGNDGRLSDARTPVSHDNTYHSATFITAAGVTLANLTTNGGTGTTNGLIPLRPADNALSADTVSEITGAAGVTVDGVELKDGNVKAVSTDAGADAGPVVNLYRNSASAADNDYIGVLRLTGKNDNVSPEDVIYGEILGQITDASDTTEDGDLVLKTMRAGTLTEAARLRSGGYLEMEVPAARYTYLMTDANVAHGIMDFSFPTTGVGVLREYDPGKGGFDIWGLSDDANTQGVRILGVIGVDDPTDTTPAIVNLGCKKNGASLAALGAAETVYAVDNLTTRLVTVLGSGNIGIGTTGPETLLHVLKTYTDTATNSNLLTIEAKQGGAYLSNCGIKTVWNDIGNSVRFTAAAIIGQPAWPGGTSKEGELYLKTKSSADGDDAPSTKMTITSTGNIGIGTTGPAKRLEIRDASAAQLRFSYSAAVYTDEKTDSSGYLYIDPTGGTTSFNSIERAELTSAAYNQVICLGKKSGGDAKLAGIGVVYYDNSGARGGSDDAAGFLRLSAGNGSIYYLWVDNTGDVRVGTTRNDVGSTNGTIVGTQS